MKHANGTVAREELGAGSSSTIATRIDKKMRSAFWIVGGAVARPGAKARV